MLALLGKKYKQITFFYLFFFYYFSKNIGFDIACKLSLKQTIYMHYQILFSRTSSAGFTQGVLKVKVWFKMLFSSLEPGS